MKTLGIEILLYAALIIGLGCFYKALYGDTPWLVTPALILLTLGTIIDSDLN